MSEQRRRTALLVGAFRSIVPEGTDSPYGSQGGFVDTLAPVPYSLANAYLKVFAEADPELAARWNVRLLNLAEPLELEDEREEVVFRPEDLDAIAAESPDILGFSTYTWNIEAVRDSVAELKRRLPGLRIVLGGRGTVGDSEGLLREIPAADVAVIGEGELPFRELLRCDVDPQRLDRVPGVVYRTGDGGQEIRRGLPPASVQSLDEIPSPYLLGVLEPPLHGVMMEFQRGCAHACGYCTWNSDKNLRAFSPERIEQEIRWVRERGHRHVTLNDSALNYNTEWLKEAVAAIKRADPEGLVHFTYNVRHDALTPEQRGLLGQVPTHMVLLGVETFTPTAMDNVDREEVDLAKLKAALLDIARSVRPPVASIVLGLPGDDERGFRHTLDTLLSWLEPEEDGVPPIGTVLVSLLQAYRGSKLWMRREELGLRLAPRGIPYLLESPTWPRESLARAKAYLLERMGRFPDQLKAAEAIVYMEAMGGLDPWFTVRRVSRLIRPWTVGMTLEGWTLEKIGVMRDTGQGVLLRFRRADGGGIRVRLTRRDPDKPSRLDTQRYTIGLRSLAGPPAPPEARLALARLVKAAIVRGEKAYAARVGRRR